jgi:two-component system, NarL family, response regulator LiaR
MGEPPDRVKNLPQLRVIVADDDPLARRAIKEALDAVGITVIAGASDGREAVELCRHYRPDVVLLDVVMQCLDGIEATRQITSSVPDVKVIVLTRSDDPEVGLMCLRAGAVGYLSKTLDFEAIPRVVQGVQRGEAAISRRLALRVIEQLRNTREETIGMRPVRSPLTPREWEVLDLLCASMGTEEIADTLFLSAETVRSHVRNILRKLGVRSRQEAVERSNALRSPS